MFLEKIKMAKPGAKKRKEIYDYISFVFENNGFAPTIREIAKYCGGMSTSHTSRHLHILRAMGFIHFSDNAARTITIAGSAWLPPEKIPGEKDM